MVLDQGVTGLTQGLEPFEVLDQIEEPEPVQVSEGATSLGFLQAVYRSADQPLSVRMKAAQAALPYEFPKLAVTAVIDGGDMAERLAQAIAQSSKVIEARPKEPALPAPPGPAGPSPRPIKAPMARLRRM
jgi:hypothetical protein